MDDKRYVLELPLKTTPYQEPILSKRFSIERKLYNILLSTITKRVSEMKKTKRYREAMNDRIDGKLTKAAKATLKDLYKEYRLSKTEFEKDLKKHRQFYKKHIDSQAGQKIASRVWDAFEKVEFGDGEEMHYKKRNALKTIQGKSNTTGIQFKNGFIEWNGLHLPVVIDTDYERDSFRNNEIAYCMIKRRFFKNKIRYYAKIVFKGEPPLKYNKHTGEIKEKLGKGKVGLDIGTSTIAISSNKEANIKELATSAQGYAKQIRRLQRAMDRSRRATNPNNFNEDGTVKKGVKKWHQSNRYKRLSQECRYLQSKIANIREYEHHLLKNYILSLGDEFYVEMMTFEQLKQREKETKITKSGRFKKKKRFGKTIGDRAPAKLLTLLDNTLKLQDKKLIKINTYEARASQFNHFDETCTKKKLSQRWNNFNGTIIQRDLYSAFLIQHINDDLSSFDVEQCRKDFMSFKEKHDHAIAVLVDTKQLSKLRVL